MGAHLVRWHVDPKAPAPPITLADFERDPDTLWFLILHLPRRLGLPAKALNRATMSLGPNALEMYLIPGPDEQSYPCVQASHLRKWLDGPTKVQRKALANVLAATKKAAS